MSRIASPGEKVSFAVTIGTILRPEEGCDHFEALYRYMSSVLEDPSKSDGKAVLDRVLHLLRM
jgi:hypothetical protein